MVSCSWATFMGPYSKRLLLVLCVLCDNKLAIDVCMCMVVLMCNVYCCNFPCTCS